MGSLRALLRSACMCRVGRELNRAGRSSIGQAGELNQAGRGAQLGIIGQAGELIWAGRGARSGRHGGLIG